MQVPLHEGDQLGSQVGVADRAVPTQIDTRCVGESIQMLGEPGFGEPGVEESGGLRALSGRDDDDSHGFHPAWSACRTSNGTHEIPGETLVNSHNLARGYPEM